MLSALDGINISLFFKLEFLSSKNENEYEALIISLISSYKREQVLGARRSQAHYQTSQQRICPEGDRPRAMSDCH